MSAGLICDHCGETLRVNSRGDDDAGESAAWLTIVTSVGNYDLCTRACAVALIESDDFAAALDAMTGVVTEIANSLRVDDEDAS